MGKFLKGFSYPFCVCSKLSARHEQHFEVCMLGYPPPPPPTQEGRGGGFYNPWNGSTPLGVTSCQAAAPVLRAFFDFFTQDSLQLWVAWGFIDGGQQSTDCNRRSTEADWQTAIADRAVHGRDSGAL